MSARSFYLVVYDIVDDKRRLKVAKYLEAVGDRVQYSVFEVYLTKQELKTLISQMKRKIKEEEDGVRVYMLCASCKDKVKTLGVGQITPPPGVMIV